MVRGDVVVDWRRDGRTQYIHEIGESLSLTNQHFNCCGLNKWKIVKNYKQTITSRSNNNLCPIYQSDASSSPRQQRFNSENSISILTTITKVELKRQRHKLYLLYDQKRWQQSQNNLFGSDISDKESYMSCR